MTSRSTSAPTSSARRIDDIDCAKEFLQHGLKGSY